MAKEVWYIGFGSGWGGWGYEIVGLGDFGSMGMVVEGVSG